MVKNNTFNGMALPAIVLKKAGGGYHILRQFDYRDFKSRLS
jgi:carboxynorspermidine decarboxylase